MFLHITNKHFWVWVWVWVLWYVLCYLYYLQDICFIANTVVSTIYATVCIYKICECIWRLNQCTRNKAVMIPKAKDVDTLRPIAPYRSWHNNIFLSTQWHVFSAVSNSTNWANWFVAHHYGDVIISALVSQITSPMIACATVYSGVDQRNHKSSASLAFVLGIHRWPVNSPHKWPVTGKMFPFDDVIMSANCSNWLVADYNVALSSRQE